MSGKNFFGEKEEEIHSKGTENLLHSVFLLKGFCIIYIIPSHLIAIIHVQFLSFLSTIFTFLFSFPKHGRALILIAFSVVPAIYCFTFRISSWNSIFSSLLYDLSIGTQSFHLFLTNHIHFPYWIRHNPMFPLSYCTL